MTSTELDDDQINDLFEATVHILGAAMDRDADEAGRAVLHVAETYGDAGMFSVCNALAAAVAKLTHGDATGLEAAVITLDGTNPDDIPPGLRRADLFAARFVAAFVNDDMGMRMALFNAPIVADDDDQAVRNVSALIHLAGSLARLKADEQR
jgi:hypothetical protein